MTVRLLTGTTLVLLVGLLTAPLALSDEPEAAAKAMGTIKSVSSDYSTFDLIIGQGGEQLVQSFEVGPATKLFLNGEEKPAGEALVVGAKATVTHPHDNDQATKVEVTAQPKDES